MVKIITNINRYQFYIRDNIKISIQFDRNIYVQ
jgi:hypothetical protein